MLNASRTGAGRRVFIAACSFVAAALVATPASAQLDENSLAKRRGQGSWLRKFKASYASLTTYMGSGTLITSGQNNPYVSQELLLYPRFNFAKNQSIRGLWSMECEMTETDRPSGRHCDPSDVRLSYHHVGLWRDPWLEGRVMGFGAVYLPTSYASRARNTVLNIRLGVGYLFNVWKLQFSYFLLGTKYFQTQKTLDAGGSAEGCNPRAGAAGCSGGPLNDNFLVMNSFGAMLSFAKGWSFQWSFITYNFFRYSVEDNAVAGEGLPLTGRADFWRNIFTLNYMPNGHVLLSLGLDTFQAVRNADRSLRNPFYSPTPYDNTSRFYLSGTFLY